MPYIKFNDSEDKYNIPIKIIDEHTIRIEKAPQNLSGVCLFLDNDLMVGDYSSYIFLVRAVSDIENIYEYSDDNHEYTLNETTSTINELTDEEIEIQNKINSLILEIKQYEDLLSQDDYIFVKSQEYSLVNKELDSYDYTSLNFQRDEYRTKIEKLRLELKELEGK